MAYKLFTDKTENFTAELKLEGADLKDSFTRLVVESDDWNLVFKGNISASGKVEIPIKKLRNVLREGTTGTIKLEVVAEDTYFTPWQSDFQVETSKKVTVEVKSQTKSKTIHESTKPKVTLTSVSNKPTNVTNATNKKQLFKEYVTSFNSNAITLENIVKHKPYVMKHTNNFVKTKNLNESEKKWLSKQYLRFLVLKSNK